MIPVLGIPVLNRPDALRSCLESINVEVERLVVIDNSGTGELGDAAAEVRPDAIVVDLPGNIGYGASVNLVIKATVAAPWWCIANADVVFGRYDLAALADEMDRGGPRWVGINDWRVFGLSAEAVEAVGFWDESYHPCYVEDADYERRCRLAGVAHYAIPGLTSHVGSIAIRSEARYAEANAKTYPRNLEYHVAKWGGPLRGGERYETPFDRGGSLGDWRVDLRRLRDQAW